jgi:hypothetical protein
MMRRESLRSSINKRHSAQLYYLFNGSSVFVTLYVSTLGKHATHAHWKDLCEVKYSTNQFIEAKALLFFFFFFSRSGETLCIIMQRPKKVIDIKSRIENENFTKITRWKFSSIFVIKQKVFSQSNIQLLLDMAHFFSNKPFIQTSISLLIWNEKTDMFAVTLFSLFRSFVDFFYIFVYEAQIATFFSVSLK